MNTELIGYFAAFCTTVSFLPQAIKTIKTRDTHALSLMMYSMFTIGVLLWLYYGITINDLPIILANLITAILAGIILFFKIRNKFFLNKG